MGPVFVAARTGRAVRARPAEVPLPNHPYFISNIFPESAARSAPESGSAARMR